MVGLKPIGVFPSNRLIPMISFLKLTGYRCGMAKHAAIQLAYCYKYCYIWRLPNTTPSVLIPELCETLPLVDMFYKRMLNLVYRCLNSQSSLVKCVARFGILSGQMDSVVGRNVLNCSLRYNTNIDRILEMEFAPHNINSYAVVSRVDSDTSTLLLELLQCCDGY